MAFFAFQADNFVDKLHGIVAIFLIFPVPFILLLFVPLLLPAYLLVASSGDYVNRKKIRKMMDDDAIKQRKEERAVHIAEVYLDSSDDESDVFVPESNFRVFEKHRHTVALPSK